MPRSYEEIVALSTAMARSLEDDHSEPTTSSAESALRAAALRRALAENELGQAVVAAREDGMSWAEIGDSVGTSGEAARQRYGRLTSSRELPGAADGSVKGLWSSKVKEGRSTTKTRVTKSAVSASSKVSRNASTGRYVKSAAATANTRVAGTSRNPKQ